MEAKQHPSSFWNPEKFHRRDVESFYHLLDVPITDQPCQALACFVARHLDPQRWKEAASQSPRVYCLGKCYVSPARGCDETRPRVAVQARQGILLQRIAAGGARTLQAYTQTGGYQALEIALRLAPTEVVRAVENSGLRGRGGAAFPTGKKWRAALLQNSAEKYIVANADEGDPGAYIDRILMEDDPHALIEGMAIAARAVGARKGWIYLRAEYPLARVILENALAEARAAGLLGERILNTEFSFDVELCVGRGSYLCGEETALLNSISGERPVAMARPPYAAERGLFGRPTVINNVETLANIPWIVQHGGEAYHALGFSKSRGTKLISLNSLFRSPGLYEVEFGIPVRTIVEELGGGLKEGHLKGVMIGAPLAGIIPPEQFDTPFGFEELHAIGASVGHGGVVAFDERTAIPELVQHVFSFGAYESCGKCTPCRLGARRIEEIFRRVVEQGTTAAKDEFSWREIISALKQTSLCGHGIGLAEFAESVVRYYGKELEPCFE